MTFVGGVTAKFAGHEPDAPDDHTPADLDPPGVSGPDTNIWYHPNDLGQVAYSELLLAGGTYGAGTGTPPTTTPTASSGAEGDAAGPCRRERRFERSEPVTLRVAGPPLGRHGARGTARRTPRAPRTGSSRPSACAPSADGRTACGSAASGGGRTRLVVTYRDRVAPRVRDRVVVRISRTSRHGWRYLISEIPWSAWLTTRVVSGT